jgi:hypothetical protein
MSSSNRCRVPDLTKSGKAKRNLRVPPSSATAGYFTVAQSFVEA